MRSTVVAILSMALFGIGVSARAQSGDVVELVFGSWRTEDISQWDTILEAFNEEYPNIQVSFQPTRTSEYDASLQASLESGTGPDLMTCRPFDQSLALYERGYLQAVTDLPGMEHFNEVARSGWVTDDGQNVYCVPMASVIHGFIYNKEMFAENGWNEPATFAEFTSLLATIKESGMTPLAIGTLEGWTDGTMLWENLGPNFWQGEKGRLALVNGTAKLTDPEFIASFEAVDALQPYLPQGHEAIAYTDTQQLFPLGGAAIFPAGSWEIPLFEESALFEMGAFKAPIADADAETCYIDDHIDIAVGMNAATEHPEEARIFLEWLTTQTFAQLYSSLQPGFFSLSDHEISLENELAQEFLSWRSECEGTIRVLYQSLSRGELSATQESWNLLPTLLQDENTPEQVAEQLQQFLWYPE